MMKNAAGDAIILMKEPFVYEYIFRKYKNLSESSGKLGRKDTVDKEYMRNSVVLVDAFNKHLYHGRQVIKPENLMELDTTEPAVPYGNDDAGMPPLRRGRPCTGLFTRSVTFPIREPHN